MSYRNTSNFEEYVAHSSDFTKVLRDVVEWDEPALAKRTALLRLASNLGLDLGEFKDAHPQQAPKYEPLWDQLCREGLATLEAGILAPTTEGLRTASARAAARVGGGVGGAAESRACACGSVHPHGRGVAGPGCLPFCRVVLMYRYLFGYKIVTIRHSIHFTEG